MQGRPLEFCPPLLLSLPSFPAWRKWLEILKELPLPPLNEKPCDVGGEKRISISSYITYEIFECTLWIDTIEQKRKINILTLHSV